MLIRRKLPENFKATDDKFFRKEYERIIAVPSSQAISNALVNHQGVVFANLRFVKESLVAKDQNPYTIFSFAKQIVKDRKIRSFRTEAIAVVSDHWYSGYFHWITDTLPRILYLLKTNADAIPMIPEADQLPFVEKSLPPFQLRKVIFLKKDEHIFTKKLLLIHHTAPTGNYNEEIIKEIRGLFRAYFQPIGGEKFERIYVSRSKSAKRRIINESAVSTLLKEYGIITIHFEDYSFEDQVRIASQASVLIGLHGAGLTNMIFMREQASVLEIRPENDDSNLCFYALASALDLRYYYQFGRSLFKIDYNDDVEVDLARLRENVEQMMKKNETNN